MFSDKAWLAAAVATHPQGARWGWGQDSGQTDQAQIVKTLDYGHGGTLARCKSGHVMCMWMVLNIKMVSLLLQKKEEKNKINGHLNTDLNMHKLSTAYMYCAAGCCLMSWKILKQQPDWVNTDKLHPPKSWNIITRQGVEFSVMTIIAK